MTGVEYESEMSMSEEFEEEEENVRVTNWFV